MPIELPLGTDAMSVRQRVEVLEKVLERAFTIPGTRQTIGLDAVVGLVPVAGDVISAVLGLYLVWEARNLGMSKFQLARMLGNVGFDAMVGAVPFAGDLFDFVFRSNSRNLRIVRRHLDKHHPHTRVIDA
ncbi:DUF4112 domain-containing protein [Novosphingobium album (ex Liu et al. 2023)]|uniref:DUF4112 domain-containing protein n=1 Tax=Novosphingobium album (ex Liu et al. 2023) TaxID=3031130 RepID=A0ABT5WL54_9SPHN|nr:DUF4112 domain-containing protein [Novosphingobium album (ex Liu et al. 2023)]MDE8650781.1 DUF4112 domain-containing protein [Novosphingobium album (ex Liu et al. 2023)]